MGKATNAEPSGGGGGAWRDPTVYTRKAAAEAAAGHAMTLQEFRDSPYWSEAPADSYSKDGLAAAAGEGEHTGTSIFDPVICEIAYRWFCPAGGRGAGSFRRRLRARHCRVAPWAALCRG